MDSKLMGIFEVLITASGQNVSSNTDCHTPQEKFAVTKRRKHRGPTLA
jgi:hypothetical protein